MGKCACAGVSVVGCACMRAELGWGVEYEWNERFQRQLKVDKVS